MNTSEITLLIPTKNRHLFLSRLIQYYKQTKFSGNLIILDASDGTNLESNKNLLLRDYYFKINHVIEGKRPMKAICDNLHLIKTKFSTLCNDDDLLITEALGQSQGFLINNDHYSACWGLGRKVWTKFDDPFGYIIEERAYNHDLKYNDNLELFMNLSKIGTYDIIYALHYSHNYVKIMNFVKQFKSERFQAIGMNLKAAIIEKIKLMNNLYLIRQNHSISKAYYYGQPSPKSDLVYERDFTEERTNNIHWLSTESFSDDLRKMINLLSIDVHKTTNLSQNESKIFIENAFVRYFHLVFMKNEKELNSNVKSLTKRKKYIKNRFSLNYFKSKKKKRMIKDDLFLSLKS